MAVRSLESEEVDSEASANQSSSTVRTARSWKERPTKSVSEFEIEVGTRLTHFDALVLILRPLEELDTDVDLARDVGRGEVDRPEELDDSLSNGEARVLLKAKSKLVRPDRKRTRVKEELTLILSLILA